MAYRFNAIKTLLLTSLLLFLFSAGMVLSFPDLPFPPFPTPPTPPAGGPGDTPFQSLCPPEKVLIGIRGRSGQLVDRIQAICVAVSNDGT